MKIVKGDKWYYHPEHGAKLCWRIDEKQMYATGWYDTPADFPTEEEDLSLDEMTKTEIEEYARTCGVELDKRKTKHNMLEDLIKHLEG